MRGDSSKCGDPAGVKMRGSGVGVPNAGIGAGLQMRGSGGGSKWGFPNGGCKHKFLNLRYRKCPGIISGKVFLKRLKNLELILNLFYPNITLLSISDLK